MELLSSHVLNENNNKLTNSQGFTLYNVKMQVMCLAQGSAHRKASVNDGSDQYIIHGMF